MTSCTILEWIPQTAWNKKKLWGCGLFWSSQGDWWWCVGWRLCCAALPGLVSEGKVAKGQSLTPTHGLETEALQFCSLNTLEVQRKLNMSPIRAWLRCGESLSEGKLWFLGNDCPEEIPGLSFPHCILYQWLCVSLILHMTTLMHVHSLFSCKVNTQYVVLNASFLFLTRLLLRKPPNN